MNKINNLEVAKVADYSITEAQTVVASSAVDLQRCAGVFFMSVIPTASGSANHLKIQVSDDALFQTGAYDLQGAIAIPKANGELCLIDITAEAAERRYVRAAVVRAGAGMVTPEIFAVKYGVPKTPVANQVTGVASKCIATPGVEIAPLDYFYTKGIASPSDEDVDVALNATITAADFGGTGTIEPTTARFQITEVEREGEGENEVILPFDWDAAVVDEIVDTVDDVGSLVLAGTELDNSTEYAVRVKYSNATVESDWGAASKFTTVAAG